MLDSINKVLFSYAFLVSDLNSSCMCLIFVYLRICIGNIENWSIQNW